MQGQIHLNIANISSSLLPCAFDTQILRPAIPAHTPFELLNCSILVMQGSLPAKSGSHLIVTSAFESQYDCACSKGHLGAEIFLTGICQAEAPQQQYTSPPGTCNPSEASWTWQLQPQPACGSVRESGPAFSYTSLLPLPVAQRKLRH